MEAVTGPAKDRRVLGAVRYWDVGVRSLLEAMAVGCSGFPNNIGRCRPCSARGRCGLMCATMVGNRAVMKDESAEDLQATHSSSDL
jgi:hypothetical protein